MDQTPSRRPVALNLVDSALAELARKGNLGYAAALYNPQSFFGQVHHASFFEEDHQVTLPDPTIVVHVLRPWLPRLLAGRLSKKAKLALSFPYYLWQLASLARHMEVDLIRARSVYYGGLLGLLVARWLKRPLVVSLGGNNRLAQEMLGRYYVFNSKFLSFRLEEWVLRGANLVLCANEYTRQYAISLGVSPAAAVLVPLRLTDDIYQFTVPQSDLWERHGIDLSRPIVSYVGRLEKDKQVGALLEAMPLVAAAVPEAQFVFVGDGTLRPALEEGARAKGLGRQAFFVGFQTTEVVKYCLKGCSLVWIPMAGHVVYEAAAAGKAIVALDVEWHAEFVHDGITGRLVPNNDAPALAAAVVELLQDPARAAWLGAQARAKIEAEFNPQAIAAREIAAYQRVLPPYRPSGE